MLNLADFISYSWLCSEEASPALKRAEGFLFSILWDIESKEKTEVYNGNWETTLILKRSNVTAVSSLKFSWSLIDPTTYFVQDYGISMYTDFPRGFNVIEVIYTAGWTADTIPTDLKYAIYDIASKIAKAWDSYGSNVKSESIDGASISWADIDKSKEESVIQSYKPLYV